MSEQKELQQHLYCFVVTSADSTRPVVGARARAFLEVDYMYYPAQKFLDITKTELAEMVGITPTILKQCLAMQRYLRSIRSALNFIGG